MTKYKSVTGSHRQLATQETRRTAGVVTAAAFAIALGLAAFTGTVALNEASLVIPEWVNAGGHCLRASRTSTFVTASLPLGSPSRIVKLLVRFDRVEPTKHTVLTIFAQDLLRSTSLKCDGRNCSDTALLTTHTDGSQHVGTIQFEYGNQYQTDFQLEQSLGVEGSLSLVQGFSYHLSATHFCWKEGALAPPTTGTVLPVHVQASALYTSAQELRDTALAAPATACNGSIALFLPQRPRNGRGSPSRAIFFSSPKRTNWTSAEDWPSKGWRVHPRAIKKNFTNWTVRWMFLPHAIKNRASPFDASRNTSCRSTYNPTPH